MEMNKLMQNLQMEQGPNTLNNHGKLLSSAWFFTPPLPHKHPGLCPCWHCKDTSLLQPQLAHCSLNRFEAPKQVIPFSRLLHSKSILVLSPVSPAPLVLSTADPEIKGKTCPGPFPPLIFHFHVFAQPLSLTICSHQTEFGGSECLNHFHRIDLTGQVLL